MLNQASESKNFNGPSRGLLLLTLLEGKSKSFRQANLFSDEEVIINPLCEVRTFLGNHL